MLASVGGWLFGQFSRVASWIGVLSGLFLIPVYAFYLCWRNAAIEYRWSDYLPVFNSSFKDELVFVIGRSMIT